MDAVTPSLAGAVVIRPAAAAAATAPAGKDSRWLTLEVCREFARANCPRSADECKYAHPPPHVEIQNGRVTCCYDSIKVCSQFLLTELFAVISSLHNAKRHLTAAEHG